MNKREKTIGWTKKELQEVIRKQNKEIGQLEALIRHQVKLNKHKLEAIEKAFEEKDKEIKELKKSKDRLLKILKGMNFLIEDVTEIKKQTAKEIQNIIQWTLRGYLYNFNSKEHEEKKEIMENFNERLNEVYATLKEKIRKKFGVD